MTELSENEKILLAREVAADNYTAKTPSVEAQCPECGERFTAYKSDPDVRRAVLAGWDTAMEHIQAQQGTRMEALEGCYRIFIHGAENTSDREWGRVYDLVRTVLGKPL